MSDMETAIGFLIAVAIGTTGVGGGVLTTPILIVFLGLPVKEAVGTALVFVAAVKTLAVPVYVWRRQIGWKALGCMLAGGIPGVLGGTWLLDSATSGGLSNLALAAVGLVVAVSAALSLMRLIKRQDRPAQADRCPLLALSSVGIGVEVGFSSAGAGALGTLALFQFARLSPAEVVGTDLLFGFVLAAIGGGFHFAGGTFNSLILIKLIAGGALGAVLGAYLTSVFPARILRSAISAWLILLGVHLCYRGLGALSKAF